MTFFVSLSGDLLLSPNLKEDQILTLGDIGKALIALRDGHNYFRDRSLKLHNGKDAIFKFLVDKQATLLEIKEALVTINDQNTVEYEGQNILVSEAISDFCKLIYKYPQVYSDIHPQDIFADEKDDRDEIIVMYKAGNGELAIRFQNQAIRDRIYNEICRGGCGQIPENYRRDRRYPNVFRYLPQYLANPEGYTPVIYGNNKDRIFFPAYKAANGEFAINLVSDDVRENFFSAFKLNQLPHPGKRIYYHGHSVGKSYANGLFNCYFDNPTQKNTIYFDVASKVFQQDRAFLKINLTKATIIAGTAILPSLIDPQQQHTENSDQRPTDPIHSWRESRRPLRDRALFSERRRAGQQQNDEQADTPEETPTSQFRSIIG